MASVQFGQHALARRVILHLSDTHLLAGDRLLGGRYDAGAHLRRTLTAAEATGVRPDAVVFTGDLTDLGEPDAYRLLRAEVEPWAARLGAPVVWVAGNQSLTGVPGSLIDGYSQPTALAVAKGASALEPAIVDRMLERPPGRPGALGYGDLDTTMCVVAGAVTPGPYLLGERFSAADVLIGSALRWGMMVGCVPQRPEFTAYVERLGARPALRRAEARDAEIAASRQAG